MSFTGVEEEQETSAPPPKKNPGSAPDKHIRTSAYNHAPFIWMCFIEDGHFATLYMVDRQALDTKRKNKFNWV